ncbi:MAG: winged helix DNA-binding protein [Clostridiales bacterium]|nr:winged helix DNA-binding protein [Clostridiales bacterium]
MENGMREIFALSFLMTRKWEVYYNRTTEKGDLSLKQLMLLIVVGNMGNEPTIKEVSSVLATSHQNVRALLNQLEKKDFVTTYSDEKDKRITRIRLKEGKEKYWAERNDRDIKLIEALFEGLSLEDIKVTAKTLMVLDQVATKKIKHE